MADSGKTQGVNEQDYVGFGISKTTGKRHEINHLPENPVWEEGIYQYEQNDKLIGGIDGIDNLQGQQLANRTAYLREKLEEHSTLFLQRGKTYAAGDIVHSPSLPSWMILVCEQAGTTAETEPDFSQAGDRKTLEDGSVVWRCDRFYLNIWIE